VTDTFATVLKTEP